MAGVGWCSYDASTGEPIVEGYNINTHNFYEIKVDFLTTINCASGT
jgi:hypothetical protein